MNNKKIRPAIKTITISLHLKKVKQPKKDNRYNRHTKYKEVIEFFLDQLKKGTTIRVEDGDRSIEFIHDDWV
ncbi:MAG: hypothetical protein QMC93_03350 [Patescibacteria group bacterium]|nr:hypothetical protein [Patescibacteria group bacterium]